MSKEKSTPDIISYIFIIALLFCSVYAIQDQVGELANRNNNNVSTANKNSNANCNKEEKFIRLSIQRLDDQITYLENQYNHKSVEKFEEYLSSWNQDIEVYRSEIDNYPYDCYKLIGIKGLATLASQLGLAYVQVVMYNDNTDVVEFKNMYVQRKNEILADLDSI